jgi:hypothetical protein
LRPGTVVTDDVTDDMQDRRIDSHHDGLGIAYVGTVCLVVWRRSVTLERFERQRTALRALADRHPQGVSFLCVIGENVPPPDAELRKASNQMVAALGNRLRCVACVIEGAGFRAATTRSVLAGMALLLRSSTPAIRIVASTAEAAAWLAQHGASERYLLEEHAELVALMSS